MDHKTLSVHEKRTTKHTSKTKKNKSIKVVYISNPLKIKTTASEFRALVQELTGRDATCSPESYKFQAMGDVGGRDGMVPDGIKVMEDDHHTHQQVPRMEPSNNNSVISEVTDSSDEVMFEPYDDVFMPQLLENFNGLLPSNLFV